MNADQHGLYRGPWKHVALRKETAGLWSVVNAVALTGYGPLALKALGLKRSSSAGLPSAEAMEAAMEIEAAFEARKNPVAAAPEPMPEDTPEQVAAQQRAKAKKKTARLKQGGLI